MNPPLHRFEEFGRLSEAERQAVLRMADAPRSIKKGYAIQGEAVPVTGFFILLSGWAGAALTLSNGGRQIMKIHLPGDALGTPSMAMRRTTEELVALTDVTVAHVSLTDFGQLFDDHPRIVARFMLSVQQERIALMDRLASNGRTPAEARTAAFLLDLLDRLRPLGHVEDDSFEVFASQEQIGDLLGLTAVHVNRMLRGLTDLGFLRREGRRFHLINIDALEQLGARPNRQPFMDQAWLPNAR
ncbi:Crp/Fnr family transcriptional regulator [Sphingomonas sp. LB3N6]|uniref:Crp/Fnr family transcriptional regulator n=1 Tax=Sphingomonas fucosidasi TaxID=3096164 RepID=UPI002FC8DC8C